MTKAAANQVKVEADKIITNVKENEEKE